MKQIRFYSEEDIQALTVRRKGEKKFGEGLQTITHFSELKEKKATYVLLGIPEEIGVRANYGKKGTSEAWQTALKHLCNMQEHDSLNAKDVLLLGTLDCEEEVEAASWIADEDPAFVQQLGAIVQKIDDKVTEVVQAVIEAGKIPILIGGGHNNSYGNLKGASEALQKPVNCINFDAHSDFRILEHRHSGNGFSYAFEEGFLGQYFIFGLHRNYISREVFSRLEKHSEKIGFRVYEDLHVFHKISFNEALQEAEKFCCGSDFGIELDMDAIAMMGSSAISPAGFSLQEARSFLHYFSEKKTCTYIHICEGAPSREAFPNQVGKAIAYLVSDILSL